MRHVAIDRRRQRGWAGMVMLLLALVVVGLVVRSVLKQMGLTEGAASVSVTRDAAAASSNDASANMPSPAAPAAASPIQRARSVQDEVLRQGARVEQQLKSADQ